MVKGLDNFITSCRVEDPGIDPRIVLEARNGKVSSETMLTELSIKNGGFNMSIEGGACALFADAFADQFVGSQAINYVEASFTSNKLPGEMLAVTIQRVSGKTPHQCRQEAEAEAAELRAQRDALAEVAQGILVEDMLQYLPYEYVDRVRAALAAVRKPATQSSSESEESELLAVMDAVADALGDAYDCTRAWSAWSIGTMGPDDFVQVSEQGERLAEIANAAIGAIRKPCSSLAGKGGE